MEGNGDIRGRAKLAFFFVNLRQRAFHKSRCAPDKGNNPHPEYTAKTAHAQGRRHTDDVPGTHPGRGGHHQCLKGRHAFFALLGDRLELLPQ